MCCKPPCERVRFVQNQRRELPEIPKVVRAVGTKGSRLHITNTDGTMYDLELPKAEPANIEEINLVNATGTKLVAKIAVKKD